MLCINNDYSQQSCIKPLETGPAEDAPPACFWEIWHIRGANFTDTPDAHILLVSGITRSGPIVTSQCSTAEELQQHVTPFAALSKAPQNFSMGP